MKKNILMLINGFGIEQKDSYEIYGPDVMPNLDRITKERIFGSIDNKFYDYKEGYRNFSIGINEALSYNLLDNNISNGNFKSNEIVNKIIECSTKDKSKLHIFCYYENTRTIEQLMAIVKELTNKGLNIFIHIVFCSYSINEYKDMANLLTRVNYEFSNAKIGIITGSTKMLTLQSLRDIQKSLITEYGENWKDLHKKIGVLQDTKTEPCDARTFTVSNGFRLAANDQILFFNYNTTDVSLFVSELPNQKYVPTLDIGTIKYYSLFPVKSSIPVPSIYNYAVSSTYALNSLKSIGAKCMIIDKKDNCSYINYYMTGLRNTVDADIKYIASDDGFIYDKDKLINYLKSTTEELVIINYELDTCENIPLLIERMKLIDSVIGETEKYVMDNNFALFITSFYGLSKELTTDKLERKNVNFYGKVPVIVADKDLPKTSYSLEEGTLYDLSNAIFNNINNKFKGKGLLKKKSSLLSILYKKPKEVKNG